MIVLCVASLIGILPVLKWDNRMGNTEIPHFLLKMLLPRSEVYYFDDACSLGYATLTEFFYFIQKSRTTSFTRTLSYSVKSCSVRAICLSMSNSKKGPYPIKTGYPAFR